MKIKACGIKDIDTAKLVERLSAEYIGFVFHQASPRYVTFSSAANIIARIEVMKVVAVMCNPSDVDLELMLMNFVPDYVQLHGGESVARVKEIRRITGCKIIKAISVAGTDDLDKIVQYKDVADMILLDAKIAGAGEVFDWSLLQDVGLPENWMLSGGLNSSNVVEAYKSLNPPIIDISSGLESSRGVKDSEIIQGFFDAAKQLT